MVFNERFHISFHDKKKEDVKNGKPLKLWLSVGCIPMADQVKGPLKQMVHVSPRSKTKCRPLNSKTNTRQNV